MKVANDGRCLSRLRLCAAGQGACVSDSALWGSILSSRGVCRAGSTPVGGGVSSSSEGSPGTLQHTGASGKGSSKSSAEQGIIIALVCVLAVGLLVGGVLVFRRARQGHYKSVPVGSKGSWQKWSSS